MERVGPQKFSRLNGIAAYKKDNIKIGQYSFKIWFSFLYNVRTYMNFIGLV